MYHHALDKIRNEMAACDENRARRSRKRDVDWAVGDAMRRNPGKREV